MPTAAARMRADAGEPSPSTDSSCRAWCCDRRRLQGDEGKGKVVDPLAERADLVIRFQGGNNAGHTIVRNGGRCSFHLISPGSSTPESTA